MSARQTAGAGAANRNPASTFIRGLEQVGQNLITTDRPIL